jgi:hypothetical protein
MAQLTGPVLTKFLISKKLVDNPLPVEIKTGAPASCGTLQKNVPGSAGL